jgi:hypothetical protein
LTACTKPPVKSRMTAMIATMINKMFIAVTLASVPLSGVVP